LQASRALGRMAPAGSETWLQEVKRSAPPHEVELLVDQYRYYYDQLFTGAELSW